MKSWLFGALVCVFSLPAAAYQKCELESRIYSPKVSISSLNAVIQFDNRSKAPIKIYWLNYKGHRVFYKQLPEGAAYSIDTYLTHPWVVTDVEGNCKGIYYPDAQLRAVSISE